MWRIRNLILKDRRNRPKYWSADVGWTWIEFSDVYTTDQRNSLPLPRGGIWEEVG